MSFQNLSRVFPATLRGRLIMGVVVVQAVTMSLFVADLTGRQHTMLLERQTEEATALSLSLAISAAGWIAADDIAGLQELVEAQRGYPEIRFAVLADREGRVLADTDPAGRGRYLLDLPTQVRQTVVSATPALVDVATPAMMGGRHVGWARLGVGQKAAGEKLAEITRSGVAYALAAILIGSLVAWFMGRLITRKLHAVQRTINAVRAGNRSARSSVAGSDEAAVMAREFDAMLDELQLSESRLNEAQRIAQLGSWQLDLVSNALSWSEEIYRIFEIDPEKFGASYDAFLNAIHPGDREAVNKAYTDSVRNRQPYELVHRLLMQDGRVKYVHERCASFYDASGRPLRSIGTVQDVTERKQAELALERANRALRTLSASNMTLVHAESEPGLLDAVCKLIVETGGYRLAWIGVPEPGPDKRVRPVAQYGHDEGFLAETRFSWADTELGRGPTGAALRTGSVQVNQNFMTNPASAPWRDAALKRGYQSSIALPLRNTVGSLGVLTIDAAEPDAFNDTEVALLKELAADLTFGIETLRTRAERDRIAYEHQHHEAILRNSLEQSIQAIAATVEARDPYTAGHERRVADLAEAIARELGLPDEKVHGMRLAATIHDLGKIQVPAEILSKPGKLSAIEFMLIKVHPQAGYDILKDIEYPWPIADIVRQHHERLDGSGYPQGLKDSQILFESRILAVADVVEAMASHRPYRAALGLEIALKEIERGRGGIYDPAVADACLKLFREARFAFQ